MQPNAALKKTSSVGTLEDRLMKLQRKDVLVGIPQADPSRPPSKYEKKGDEPEPTNAELMYLHTHGSRLQNIPPRPVIEPAIWAPGNRENIAAELGDAARGVLEGRPQDAALHLEMAGTVAANASKRWFTDPRNGWLPNSQKTINRKGSDRPLIDTGELRRAITYVVEET